MKKEKNYVRTETELFKSLPDEMKLYKLKELEDVFSVSRRALLKWIDAGKLKAHKFGNRWMVTESDLKEFIQKRETNV